MSNSWAPIMSQVVFLLRNSVVFPGKTAAEHMEAEWGYLMIGERSFCFLTGLPRPVTSERLPENVLPQRGGFKRSLPVNLISDVNLQHLMGMGSLSTQVQISREGNVGHSFRQLFFYI
ncbi:hypothetical protein ATANTOWER_007299 [Ataeniobius toweri]|uniref:Uncharacterized protein n=1 Tax=Ataeniobius toweri TaxID=208326 RepID=A0ABU7BY92_9TELE|nr:hypothetical protein [Ataeniobius toweri]